ncbi:hypothetical protein C7B62_20475 [Pleurocapsa sp. CCALA 161]|uniref:hypothetical protein n=1 Tax=Pleurocapsa sp. CCALA 161 TaxID=2107688 RepID=UPI000D0789A3|nr:hypothetical protein [Pleurocapsa sp. CCALA 161]PSB07251.1 hypothetical protein C7B62_20475 [Pleurocapsa sp. CCALA 161]
MTLAKFRHQYPQGSLVSELVEIDRGTYIVKALVQIDNLILATALASASTVEAAEDAAKERAIATLCLDLQPNINSLLPQPETAKVEVQPATLSVNPEIKSEGTNNHKIVNFSKPQTESATQTQNLISETITSPTVIEEPLPLPQPDLSAQVSPVNLDYPTETNLFGDTFSAEIPTISTVEDNQVDVAMSQSSPELEAMDFNEIKQKTDIEIKRLSWTKDQGKEFLMSHYGKRSRLHLTDEQLLEFLRYLEKLPNPVK